MPWIDIQLIKGVLPHYVYVDICSKNRDKVFYYNLGVLSRSSTHKIQLGLISSRDNLTKSQTMNRQIEEQLANENKLIGISKEKTKILLGEPDLKSNEEWVYIIKKYCFGLIKKRLHIFFFEEKARDYYIGIL